ncbi:uncharacterized protein KY384_001145 [Bacidia gigantensis]|uniref:uncharacterized protein n=1 Tax=Bacidia gigantensis TaxID=2732470 RepID=UPI001D047744|nr:uncharacterized protein KY384_001145 [Bacidia gigantensis]KAG8534301.1 hypothetical protein KY384_001145 [Bacidia gigantensis]
MDSEHCSAWQHHSEVSETLTMSYILAPCLSLVSAKTRELQATLAGQIARALAVFCVDEIVIFDDGQFVHPPNQGGGNNGDSHVSSSNDQPKKYTGYTDPSYFLAHILSYLECPPQFRRMLFPMHPDLQHAGILPSLDMPHHLKKDEWCQYREGVAKSGSNTSGSGTTIFTGLEPKLSVALKQNIPENTRVTLNLGLEKASQLPAGSSRAWKGAAAVAPSQPREDKGLYWGYTVRTAESLSAVMTECPFDGGYDLTFGTSERGQPVQDFQRGGSDEADLPQFDHMLIVFGGVAGLEAAVKADKELEKLKVRAPETLFDYWVNVVPGQGSRTMRTEEAVWVGLTALRGVALAKGRD